MLALAALCPAVAMAGLEVAVDWNGDGILRTSDHGDPLAPLDQSTPGKPFIFWLNTDQDDQDYYETWPLDRADYETDGIDSLRDLEDFARLLVRLPAPGRQPVSKALRFTAEGRGGEFAINIYHAADRECGNVHLLKRSAGERQREAAWDRQVGVIRAGETLDIPLTRMPPSSADNRSHCFLFEGRHEGLAGVRVALVRDGAVLMQSEPAWISIRHVKRLYERVVIPWPEGRKDAWDYEQPPPPLELNWQDDPQGFAFEPPWHETDDVIVWVYGWLKTAPGMYEMSTVHSGETIYKRLWHRGYRGRLVMFHWPTIKQKITLGLMRSEYRGYKSGPVLADHVHSYPPDKRVHVTAHSLGGIPLAAALAAGMEADTVVFQASAIPAEALDPNPALILPGLENITTPIAPDEGGYHHYLRDSRSRVYSLYNTADITFFGWNIAQKQMKQSAPWFKSYRWDPGAPEGERATLKTGLFSGSRPVTDPDEVRAFIAHARTHALGAEPRVRGVVHEAFDLDRAPYHFGTGHVVAWAWNPQRTTAFYNLVLDLFNIRYNSEFL